MNIFVAFFVLLLLLADSTPPAASSIPLIGMLLRHMALYECVFIDWLHFWLNW